MEPRAVITRKAEGGALVAGIAVIPGTDTNLQVKLPTAADERGLGIVYVGAAEGAPLSIVVLGIVKAIADAAIAVGDPVGIGGTDGHLKKVAPAAGDTDHVMGYALSSAAADGDEFDMLVCPSSVQTED